MSALLLRRRRWTAILLLLLASAVTGCHAGRPRVPVGWRTADGASRPAVSDGTAEHAQLQVLICYGSLMSNHAALRLVCPGKPTLLWDPGGGYHASDPVFDRRADVVVQGAPSVDQWWHYRRDSCGEPFMEAFEWDLQSSVSLNLHQVLRRGTVYESDPSAFSTDAAAGACGLAVSGFVQRFLGSKIRLEEAKLWPHDLATALWRENPDRVGVYERGKDKRIYVLESTLIGRSPSVGARERIATTHAR